jgi:hypothetical protein
VQFLALIGVVVLILLVCWGGVELNDLIHQYPGQFYMGVFAVLFIAAAAGAARFYRVTHDQVPLRPKVPEMPKAIEAVPLVTAIAAPHTEEAQACEGPGCGNKVDDDPWTAAPEDDPDDKHRFCSHRCARRWSDRQPV